RLPCGNRRSGPDREPPNQHRNAGRARRSEHATSYAAGHDARCSAPSAAIGLWPTWPGSALGLSAAVSVSFGTVTHGQGAALPSQPTRSLRMTPTEPTPDESARDLANRFWERILEEEPLIGTSVGDERYDDRLPDPSEEGLAARSA